MVKAIDMSLVEHALQGFTIPPQPQVLRHIQQQLNAAEPDLNRIASLIALDIGIAGFTLKVVNSAYFGLRNKITSVEQACRYLGLNRVVMLVRSVLLRFTLEEGRQDEFSRKLWTNALHTATLAMTLAKQLNFDQQCQDDCYSLGLFRNAGMALIHAQFPDYPKVLTVGLSKEMTFADIEQRFFNTSHEMLGFMIAQSWGLAAEISNVIAYHHQPELMLHTTDLYEKRLFAILKLAEHLTGEEAALFDVTLEQEWQQYGEALLDILELDELTLHDLGDYLQQQGVPNRYHA